MKTALLGAALISLTAGLVVGYPRHDEPVPVDPPAITQPVPANKPKIEAVFVLDTTGSMSGLIQAAKENIWSIASSMAQAQPAPELKIGLVAFRDRGDDYVTRVTDLSTDLDSMYATLMDYQAGGGGDGPEAVNQALFDAVNKIGWSQDPNAYKVIFLVGDAPPHMDYPDDVKYPETIKQAAARGIIVNTIQAGSDPETRAEWNAMASLGQGKFLEVAQSGNAIAVTTPFDERIAALAKELDDTRMYFGDAKQQEEAQRRTRAASKVHAESSPAAQAKRAAFNASAPGKANFLGDNELVDAVAKGKVDLAALPAAALPAPLRELSLDEQAKVVQATAEKRAKLEADITTLSRQRSEHIAAQLKDRKDKDASLDYKLFGAVKEQAAAKGLSYEAAAPVN